MKTNRMSTVGLMVAVGIGALAVGELRAWGVAPAAVPAAPKTSVAIVNLEKLMAQLDETEVLNKELKSTFDKRKKEFEEVVNRARALETERDMLPAESRERRQKAADAAEAKKMAEARHTIYQALIDLDNGELIRAMYTKIIASINSFSQKEGVDLVMLDDRGITLPTSATQSQVNSAIQAKRVLFASDTIDITDRLAKIMNADYNSPTRK